MEGFNFIQQESLQINVPNEKVSLQDKIKDIPEDMSKAFSKRAIRDTKKIISMDNEKFHEIAYCIFRAYCIGFIMGQK